MKAACVLAVSLLGVTLVGADDAPLPPEVIKASIESGAAAKDVKFYSVSRGPMGRITCMISTPTLRIRLAARNAKKQYKEFTEADVTENMIAPTAEVFCPSVQVGGNRRNNAIASVQHIVLTAKDGKSPKQPIATRPMAEEYQNAFGATSEGAGMIAVFPLSALRESAELHAIYDHKVHFGFSGCEDCAIELDPKKFE